MNDSTRPVGGVKTLLTGPTGTGKTYALRTLIDAGITPMILATEPNVELTIGDLPKGSYHLHYVRPSKVAWADMKANAKMLNTMSFEALAKTQNMNKAKYTQFFEVLDQMENFTCQVDGQNYGSVDSWQTDKCLWFDSLSGLSIMAMDLVAGGKPMKSMADWGVSMDNLERFVNNLCFGLDCHVVLTAHMEREKDEISGATKSMVSTLGSKLAPKIPRYFDNVIETRRVKDIYTWETDNQQADLKARNLPIAAGLPPTFVPIIEDWKRKGGIIHQPPKEVPPQAGQ